jgi:hypothetical protein
VQHLAKQNKKHAVKKTILAISVAVVYKEMFNVPSGNALIIKYRVFQNQLYKSEIYSEDMYSVSRCHNVAKHAEFNLG